MGPHKGTVDYVQERPQKTVFLKVGGRAVVFLGANLKIRCPTKNHANRTILWYKDNKEVRLDIASYAESNSYLVDG